MKKVKFIGLAILIIFLVGCASDKASKEAIENNKRVAAINIQLGMKYLERKDYQRAKTKLLLAMDQAPQLPEAWYAMGYYLEITGDKKNAGQYFLKAVEISPTRGDVQNNYGTFLCRTGQYKKAIEHFLIATKDPDYLDVASAYENAGLCSLKIPDKTMAIQYFRRAVAQDPERKLSLNELAKLTKRGK